MGTERMIAGKAPCRGCGKGAAQAPVQRLASTRAFAADETEAARVRPGVLRPSSGGAPLPSTVRAKMEAALGHDFRHVRVHHGPEAASIGALAFARGSHLHFAPGQYQPHSAAGQRVLAHELAHVVQQRAGRVANPGGALPVNHDPALEAEAEAAAAQLAGGRAPAAPAAPAGPVAARPGAAPIQPLLTRDQFTTATPGKLWGGYGRGANDATLGKIDTLLAGYHALGATAPTTPQQHQQLSDDRLRHLHEIEHHIYRWSHQKKAEPANRYRAGMMQLLDSVQTEHQTQVWNTHQQNLKPWVPGRDQMSKSQQKQLRRVWNKLRNGTGNITVEPSALEGRGTPGEERPPNFDREVLANHARLLTTPGGRKLLRKLNRTGAPGVRVIPKHSIAAGGADALATNDNPGHALATPDATQPQGFRRGVGSASVLKLTAGMRDTDATNEDASGNAIPSPAWLVYGHELIHALHNQRGGNRRVVNAASYAGGTPNQRWTSAEEHQTIALGTTSENRLRSEHGLTRRKWHS